MRWKRPDLHEVILHDISDDAKLVEVSPPPLCAKRLLEGDLHVADVLVIPDGPQERVGESQHQHVLHQLLPQVVVDSAGHKTARQCPILAQSLPALRTRVIICAFDATRPWKTILSQSLFLVSVTH